MLPPLTLVLGGISSGKSAYAESITQSQGETWLYLATMPANADDAEMQQKIARHRARRGEAWQTLHTTLDLAEAIRAAQKPVLVDCLTLWLSNLMEAERDLQRETSKLSDALASRKAPITLVSNEVGLGGVSANALARRFAREQGQLNQTVAEMCTNVAFVAAGLPIMLKGQSPI